MSGKKGMIRYSEEIKEQVRKEVQAGQSQREISRRYGISGYTVQSWCGLRPETKLRQAAPLRKGRPGKIKTIEDYEKENKRLKMENELLRIFCDPQKGSEREGKVRGDLPSSRTVSSTRHVPILCSVQKRLLQLCKADEAS